MWIKDAFGAVDPVQFLRVSDEEVEEMIRRMQEEPGPSVAFRMPRPVRCLPPVRERAKKLLEEGGPADSVRQLIVDWIAEEPSIVTRSIAEALTAREGDGGYRERLLEVLRMMVARE